MFGHLGQPMGANCPTCLQKLQFADFNTGASRSPCKRCQQRALDFERYPQQPLDVLLSETGCKRNLFSRDGGDHSYRGWVSDNYDRISPGLFTHSTSSMESHIHARPSAMPSLSPSLARSFQNMMLPLSTDKIRSRPASTDPVYSMPLTTQPPRSQPLRPVAQRSNLVQCQNPQCGGFIQVPPGMPLGQNLVIKCLYCGAQQLY